MDKGNKAWIGVDLDGCLAHYEAGEAKDWDGYSIGKPIPEMVERVKKMLQQGKTVKIFTARVSRNGDPRGVHISKVTQCVQDWCEKHLGQRLEVTCEKDYFMTELYDDRARQVVLNKGLLVDELLEKCHKFALKYVRKAERGF